MIFSKNKMSTFSWAVRHLNTLQLQAQAMIMRLQRLSPSQPSAQNWSSPTTPIVPSLPNPPWSVIRIPKIVMDPKAGFVIDLAAQNPELKIWFLKSKLRNQWYHDESPNLSRLPHQHHCPYKGSRRPSRWSPSTRGACVWRWHGARNSQVLLVGKRWGAL